MATTLYVLGSWSEDDNDLVLLSSRSLVVLFTLQAACDTLPVQVAIVQEEAATSLPERLSKCSLGNSHFRTKGTEQRESKAQVFSQRSGEMNSKFTKIPAHVNAEETTSEKCSKSACQDIFQVAAESRRFSSVSPNDQRCLFPVRVSSLAFPVSRVAVTPSLVRGVALPAALCGNTCVAGTCAALRCVLHLAAHDSDDAFAKKLLGFREGCLQSCSEVSCWTKFCEIEMPNALENVFSRDDVEEDSVKENVFPETLLRFNNHMLRPPILHNALKRKQQFIRKTVKDKKEKDLLLSKKLCELPELDHDFAEGLDITLADVMLFICFDLIVHKFSHFDYENVTPLVIKWLQLISSNDGIVRAVPMLDVIKSKQTSVKDKNGDSTIVIPEVIEESLYKSDPERPKLHCTGNMTLQRDIDRVIESLVEAGVSVEYEQPEYADSLSLPWSSYPSAVHPQEGELPPSRLQRKCEQLENIVSAVMQVSQSGQRIVDFCAGGGHVAIVLAYCLPQCTVAMVENKASSLDRARARVERLGLTNVEYYQCNLDYFCGKFDIGVCLHACGPATDLVLMKCYEQNASFVCSPCCYGAIQPNHSVQYPLSVQYQRLLPRLTDYLTLGHAADQTHGPDHPSSAQGQRCMRLLDGDRLAYATQLGYRATLLLMTPASCSPKNHILVGSPLSSVAVTA